MQEFLERFGQSDPELIESFAGVSPEDICRMEQDLGVALPADYRDFLMSMGAGSAHPDSRYFEDDLVLLRRGRRYISFHFDTVWNQRSTKNRWIRNKRRDWIRIGKEDGSTGCDPYLHAESGRVVLATHKLKYLADWFSSFRQMLFALGFYWLDRPGREVHFMPLADPDGTRGQRPPGSYLLAEPSWETKALRDIAKTFDLLPCQDVPGPSLAFKGERTTVVLSNLFRTASLKNYELVLSSTSSEELLRLVPILEDTLRLRHLGRLND